MNARQASLKTAALLLLAFAAATALPKEPAKATGDREARPNFVIVLADDLGWRDLGCYGSAFYHTPHVDALSRRGVRFTQAYAANPLCSPTRSSILTGLYPARTGITAPVCHLPKEILEKGLQTSAPPFARVIGAESLTRLKQSYVTLAERLKAAGYVTAHFGKWHLGPEPYDPLHQGFDVDWPHVPTAPGPGGKTGYLAPWDFMKATGIEGRPGEHIEDRMSTEAVKFIRQHKDVPFYLNYWAFSVHSPWTAKPELVEEYRKSVDPNAPQRSPVYAAMVESFDEAVGRLVAAIDQSGIADRTIIIFYSDNGGVHWLDERMTRMYDLENPPTSNLPLRGGKATIYEGGTREPCLVVWPGVTKAGSTCDALVSSVDLYPTVLEMVGQRVKSGQKIDGVSFVPALRGGPGPRDTIYCHFPHGSGGRPGYQPSTSVRRGDWKLIRFFADNEDQTDRFELYNLEDDLGETRNLAGQMPEKVAELNELIGRFLAETDAVVPVANPAYRTARTWAAGRDANAEFHEGIATVNSDKDRPTLHLIVAPEGTGQFVVKFRMRIAAGQGALVLWGTDKARGFAATRRAPFEVVRDGAWHDYEVAFSTPDSLRMLRIDGSLAPTKVEFDWIQLCRPDGTVLRTWEF